MYANLIVVDDSVNHYRFRTIEEFGDYQINIYDNGAPRHIIGLDAVDSGVIIADLGDGGAFDLPWRHDHGKTRFEISSRDQLEAIAVFLQYHGIYLVVCQAEIDIYSTKPLSFHFRWQEPKETTT